jgi:hypothetical protein
VVYKSRSALRTIGSGRWKFYNDDPIELPARTHVERGEIHTYNHDLSLLGKGDVGGPFWSSQSRYESDGNYVRAQGLGRWYEGTIHLGQTTPMGSFPAKPLHFDSVVAAGATAISRTIPTNPIAGASVAIGEAREGFPRFVGSTLFRRTRELRNVGDEYLNVEFGWKPMIRDLLEFSRSVKDSNKVLRQMYRDSGANNSVRRRYVFPIQKSSSEPDGPKWGYVAPFKCDGSQLDSWMLGSGPIPIGYRQWSTTETRTWFSGAYSYVMPRPPTNFVDNLDKWDAEANKLFGTRLTPATVWNLAPWSWAADWFSNTGDVLHNISAFGSDSLVLKYGYIMRKTREMQQSIWQGYVNTPTGANQFVTAREAFGHETRVRLRATPYGFGIDMGSFTPRQIAISAAVGITQAPRISL